MPTTARKSASPPKVEKMLAIAPTAQKVVVVDRCSAIDFTDSRTHEASATGVHGTTGNIVDTLSVQTMSNKTLNAPVVSGGTISGSIAGTPTFTGVVTHSAAANLNAGGALAGTFTGTPTFSGAMVFSGNPNFSGTPTFSSLSATTAAITTMSGNPTFSGTPVFASTSTFNGASTHTAATNLNAGGNLGGTFTGSPTLSGNPIFSGSPSFTGSPTFTPTQATDGSIIVNTVSNGWSLDSAAGRKAGGVTTIRVNVERVGSNIVASASGNDGTMITNYDMSGIATGSVSLGNDGIVTMKSLSAGNTIGLADTVNFTLTFANST